MIYQISQKISRFYDNAPLLFSLGVAYGTINLVALVGIAEGAGRRTIEGMMIEPVAYVSSNLATQPGIVGGAGRRTREPTLDFVLQQSNPSGSSFFVPPKPPSQWGASCALIYAPDLSPEVVKEINQKYAPPGKELFAVYPFFNERCFLWQWKLK
ncbi:hypothetical protein KY358_03800 [Candidatus Woesearchaeota archaeon]|nr:hypothetical protein [Candidatus Woesearchaeota archaeon]